MDGLCCLLNVVETSHHVEEVVLAAAHPCHHFAYRFFHIDNPAATSASLTIPTESSVVPRISDTQLHPRASPGRREDEDEIVGREDHNLDETKGKIVECFVIENLWA